jgi:hypothetical protein
MNLKVPRKKMLECLLRFRVEKGEPLGRLEKYLARGEIGTDEFPRDLVDILRQQGIETT